MTDALHAVPDSKPVADNSFQFSCHPGVSCYLTCCRKVELRLFPIDLVRLKNALDLHSGVFLEKFTRIGTGSHPLFPAVMLNMAATEEYPCPFLAPEGCTVYRDRPSACRTYPLERGVAETGKKGVLESHYFITDHPYCKGHLEEHHYTIKKWERSQQLHEYNLYNDLWAVVDAFFATDPWQGEGQAGARQQLAFMVCYNIDVFREYTQQQRLLNGFRLDRDLRRRIERDDLELLKFGFNWLLFILGDRRTLIPR